MPVSNFLYYWARFLDDTQNERRQLYKLNQNSPEMENIAPGDRVIAIANIYGDYQVVAIFLVDEVGENPRSDPDFEEYGRFYFRANASKSIYLAPHVRRSVEKTIRSSAITANAAALGQSFQGRNGVRRLKEQDAARLMAAAMA